MQKINWVEIILGILAPVLSSVGGYIVGRVSSFYKNLTSLVEQKGKQDMINKALWREIDKLKKGNESKNSTDEIP